MTPDIVVSKTHHVRPGVRHVLDPHHAIVVDSLITERTTASLVTGLEGHVCVAHVARLNRQRCEFLQPLHETSAPHNETVGSVPHIRHDQARLDSSPSSATAKERTVDEYLSSVPTTSRHDDNRTPPNTARAHTQLPPRHKYAWAETLQFLASALAFKATHMPARPASDKWICARLHPFFQRLLDDAAFWHELASNLEMNWLSSSRT